MIPDPTGQHQLRMFYTSGWEPAAIRGAVSDDNGNTWTRGGVNLIGLGAAGEAGGAAHTGLCKETSLKMHYFFTNSESGTTTLKRATTTDGGLTWGNVVVALSPQGWESGRWGNSSCVIKNGVWHLLYECLDPIDSVWKVGYATSPDGLTWTRQNGGNPINSLQTGTGSYGGCDLHLKSDGTWELFYHATPSGYLPSYIYRALSTDLINWERRPGHPILVIDKPFEYDQVADPCVLELNGQRVMWYSGVDNRPNPGISKFGRAVYSPDGGTSAPPVNTTSMLGADGIHPNDAGMTYLADVYQQSLSSAGKTPAQGTNVYAYGDSWTASDIQNAPGKRAIVQLANRLGLTLVNRAVSGDMAADCAARAIGLAPFPAGTPGLVMLPNVGFNDEQHADTAQQRSATAANLRALLATVSAGERIEQSANSGTTGTWSTGSPASASGGSNLTTTTDGATISFNITNPGDYYLLSHGTDGSAGWIGGILTVSQGGTTKATLDLNGLHVNTTNKVSDHYGPVAVRIPNVAAGTLTISFSTSGRSGAMGWVDALLRVSDTPPTVLAVKPLRVTSSLFSSSLLGYIRTLYDTLGAEFGSHVVLCDPNPGWTP